jgi:hypothetical protein
MAWQIMACSRLLSEARRGDGRASRSDTTLWMFGSLLRALQVVAHTGAFWASGTFIYMYWKPGGGSDSGTGTGIGTNGNSLDPDLNINLMLLPVVMGVSAVASVASLILFVFPDDGQWYTAVNLVEALSAVAALGLACAVAVGTSPLPLPSDDDDGGNGSVVHRDVRAWVIGLLSCGAVLLALPSLGRCVRMAYYGLVKNQRNQPKLEPVEGGVRTRDSPSE